VAFKRIGQHGTVTSASKAMAALRVRRTWWIMGQTAEPPLFRLLARKWRPVDRRERRMKPFQLALAAADIKPITRNSFGPNKRVVLTVDKVKKSARKWNPWMMMR
jgi:hypothetical protein